jgi:hypothetical protein
VSFKKGLHHSQINGTAKGSSGAVERALANYWLVSGTVVSGTAQLSSARRALATSSAKAAALSEDAALSSRPGAHCGRLPNSGSGAYKSTPSMPTASSHPGLGAAMMTLAAGLELLRRHGAFEMAAEINCHQAVVLTCGGEP